jgi:type III pantothenate kinase
MTFLAIDVGNTRLKWTLYERPAVGTRVLAHGVEFLEQLDGLADGAWASLPEPTRMLGCVVAGPAVKRRVQEQMERWSVEPRWVVASEAEAGLVNGYDFPARLGADRWVAMVGARHHMLARGRRGRFCW